LQTTDNFDFGLTEEQKNLVLECLASGVNTPTNILIIFRAKKIKVRITKTFGAEYTRVFCYFHVIKANDKYLNAVRNTKQRNAIKFDITLLKQAPSQSAFNAAATLFVSKWRGVCMHAFNRCCSAP
jgi:hypothetical protein